MEWVWHSHWSRSAQEHSAQALSQVRIIKGWQNTSVPSSTKAVRFLGGDAQLNADEVGGDAFKAWKNTIRDDPVPVQRTIVPITELVRVFAGPNDGEQCPSHRVVNQIHQRAKMLECTTQQMISEARRLADLDYEISEAERLKADAHAKILEKIHSADSSTSSSTAESKAWLEQCRVVASLKMKRQQAARRLFRWSFRSEEQEDYPIDGSADGSVVCTRELKKIKKMEKKQMYHEMGMESIKVNLRTGDKSLDRCTMCKTVYNAAKCLATTSGECGIPKSIDTDVMHRIRSATNGIVNISDLHVGGKQGNMELCPQ